MHLLNQHLGIAVAFLIYAQTFYCAFPLQNVLQDTHVVYPDLYEASVAELQDGLNAGHFSSVNLVKTYCARIEEVNTKGPELRAVIELNPSALATAAHLDEERRKRGPRSALHRIPVLLKDSIATIASEGMNTTAGSYALPGSIVPRDAGVVTRLRKAIILGKANLSEWAHFRGATASGWSARGGQATNPYYPQANPCGSSSGSAIAAAIWLSAITLGTETDGSISCPSAHTNIVGIKPTVGLTSRAGVIPISRNQDTVGPMTRNLVDAAIVLSIITGKDANDNFTLAQPSPVPDFTKALKTDALVGKRIGVPRRLFVDSSSAQPALKAAFEKALLTLSSLLEQRLSILQICRTRMSFYSPIMTLSSWKLTLKHQEINVYLAGLESNPSGVRTLANLIQFSIDHPELEMSAGYEDQSEFIRSEATVGYNATYYEALNADHDLGRTRGIDATLKKHRLDALVAPLFGFSTSPAAVAGYPIITVPLGFFPDNVTADTAWPPTMYPAPGLPFGLSFWGTAFSEFDLIGMAYAFEQATQVRLKRRAYPTAIPRTQLEGCDWTIEFVQM